MPERCRPARSLVRALFSRVSLARTYRARLARAYVRLVARHTAWGPCAQAASKGSVTGVSSLRWGNHVSWKATDRAHRLRGSLSYRAQRPYLLIRTVEGVLRSRAGTNASDTFVGPPLETSSQPLRCKKIGRAPRVRRRRRAAAARAAASRLPRLPRANPLRARAPDDPVRVAPRSCRAAVASGSPATAEERRGRRSREPRPPQGTTAPRAQTSISVSRARAA